MPECKCKCGTPLLEASDVSHQLGLDLRARFGGDALRLAHAAGIVLEVSTNLRSFVMFFHPPMNGVTLAQVSAIAHPDLQAWMVALAAAFHLERVDEQLAYVGRLPDYLEEDLYRAEEFASAFVGWSPDWAPASSGRLSLWDEALADVDLDPEPEPRPEDGRAA